VPFEGIHDPTTVLIGGSQAGVRHADRVTAARLYEDLFGDVETGTDCG